MKAPLSLLARLRRFAHHRRTLLAALIVTLLSVHLVRAASEAWDGNGADGLWSDIQNWLGLAAPGATGTTNNTDVATFNAPIANTWGNSAVNPVVIDAGRNISGINFDSTAGNYFIGSTSGNALNVSDGGSIQILSTLTATNAVHTINAPLQIQGANATYTLANNSANGAGAGAGTLKVGGGITGGTSGATVLALSGNNTNNNTISGVIANGAATSVGLVKNGLGTWVLTAANTYTGGTTLNGGVIGIGHDAALGSGALTVAGGSIFAAGGDHRIANNLTLNGTLTVADDPAGAHNLSLGGTLSGAGGLIKNGSGTLTLAGSNLQTGGTTVNAGAVRLSGSVASPGSQSLSGAVNLAGATAQLILDGGAGLKGQYFNAAPNQSNFASTAALQSHLNTVPLALEAGSAAAGANFDFGTDGSNFPAPYSAGLSNNFEARWTGQFNAQTVGSYTFSTTSDDGSVLFIDGVQVVNNNFFQGFTKRTGTLSLSAGLHDVVIGYYQGGGGYGLQATVTTPGGSEAPLANALMQYTTNSAIGSLSGVAGSQVVLNGGQLTVNQSVDGTFSGVISDGNLAGGQLVKSGAGTLILTAANTYTGPTTINAGILQLGNGGASGSIAGNVIDNGSLVFNRIDSYNFAGNISGTGSLTQAATGALFLVGTNTYTGGTTINAGIVIVGNGGTSGSIAGDVTNNSSLSFNRSDSYTFAGNISGPGNLTHAGTGTLTLAGTNTYTGGTSVVGTLRLGGTAATPSAQSLSGPVNLVGSTARLELAGGQGLQGQYFNAAPDTNNFVSTAALQSHLNTVPLAMEVGSAAVGANFDFGTGGSNFPAPYSAGLSNNFEARWTGQFNAQTVGTYTFSTSSDDGSVLFIDGVQVVDNNFFQGFTTRTGTVSLSAGLHDIVIGYFQGGGGYGLQATVTAPGGSEAPLANALMQYTTNSTIGSLSGVAGSQVVLNGGQLTVNQSVNGTFAGAISDGNLTGGRLAKSGPATLILTGVNTYTGPTTVSQGRLLVNGSISGSATMVTNAGSTLGGTGTVGDVTVNSGAILEGGDGSAASGALTSGGAVLLLGGSIIELTLGPSAAHSSLVRTGGSWSFDSTQTFVFDIEPGATATTYDNIISGLSGFEPGLSNVSHWTISTAGVTGTFSYDGSGGVDLNVLVIPEPGSAALLLAGFPLLARRRRRKVAAASCR